MTEYRLHRAVERGEGRVGLAGGGDSSGDAPEIRQRVDGSELAHAVSLILCQFR